MPKIVVTPPPIPLYQKPRYVVLLLGAGFSAPWDYPVMRNFTATARRRQMTLAAVNRESPLIKDYEELFKFQEDCRRSSWAFNRDWENIEELYSQADLLRLSAVSGDKEQVAQDRCKSIAWSIWDTYRGAAQFDRALSSKKHVKPLPLKPLIRSLAEMVQSRDMDLVAITTNYDLLFESACRDPRAGTETIGVAYPGFEIDSTTLPYLKPLEIDPRNGVTIAPHNNLIPLVKLHGSANWFTFTAGKEMRIASIEHSEKQASDASIDGPNFRREVLQAGIKNAIQSDLKDISPLIVPPMLGKMALDPVLRIQWQSAIDYLRNAVHLIVVGYSFPETDVFMPRLLSEGLAQNLVLEQIAIVNSEKREAWTDRLARIFSPTVRDAMVRYYEGSSKDLWADMPLRRVLEKKEGPLLLAHMD